MRHLNVPTYLDITIDVKECIWYVPNRRLQNFTTRVMAGSSWLMNSMKIFLDWSPPSSLSSAIFFMMISGVMAWKQMSTQKTLHSNVANLYIQLF